jgi:hypothetical protein
MQWEGTDKQDQRTKGCRDIRIPDIGAPSGTYKEPLTMPSIIPPPSVLCRRISRGRAGSVDGSLVSVSCAPTVMATSDASIPVSGPARAKSNIASLFFGGSLNVVTELVVPVIKEGTIVGNEIFI